MNRINGTKRRLFGAVWVKKVVMMMVVLYKGLFLADMVCANNVRITGEPDIQLNATSDSLMLKFTLSWDNSWRDDFNWDAVWLFVKYKREGSQDAWSHLYLSPLQEGTSLLEIDPGNTGDKIVGAFVYPKNSGAFNISGEQVVLKASLNGLSASDITNRKIYFAVQAIEMVLIPYGPYYLGDGFSHHTFRSVPTRIIPADADIIGTDTSFRYSCIPAHWGQASAAGAADRVNDARWEPPYTHVCHISLDQHGAYNASHNTSWTVNFKTPKTIRTFGVASVNYTDVNGDYLPSKDWYLLGSNDSLVWDTLKRCTREMMVKDPVSYPVRHAIRVEHPGAYQYYRVFFLEINNGNNGFMLTNVAMSEQNLYPDTSDNYYVDSEDAIPYGETLDGLYVDDGTTWSGSLPAAYPKGYKGFYMMKYELSQEQYVNFLNMLSYPQQKSRIGNNLDHLHRGDYVFGDPAYPSCRNGIAVFSHKGSAQPVVFGNNLNPADPFFAGDDGQTLACNYLKGPDMLAYLDWSGLRPLSELEYEKACRTPDRSLAGEYAWNTTAIHHLGGQHGLSSSTEGTENEVPSALDVNVNSGTPSFGPVRCGSFGSNTSNQQQSGASFYGVMELSGNLGEMCYSVFGGSGLNVSSSNNEYHGDGVIASDGNHNVSGYWNGSSATGMLSIRGGSFASADSLLRVSDRSVLMDYDNSLRDSTVTFRGVRSISKSVDPGEIVTDATCPGFITIENRREADASAGVRYQWYIKRPGSSVYELIEGESGAELRDYELSNSGTSATETYTFRRKAFSFMGTASAETEVSLRNAGFSLDKNFVFISKCEVMKEVTASPFIAGGEFSWSYEGHDIIEGLTTVGNNNTCGLHREIFGGDAGLSTTVQCSYAVNGCVAEKDIYVRIERNDLICPSSVVDEQGNQYAVTKAGCQCWMKENLRRTDVEYCPVGDPVDMEKYGVHYYWAAVMNGASSSSANPSGVQGICPAGWHLPSVSEWNELITVYGGAEIAGGYLKSYMNMTLAGHGYGCTNAQLEVYGVYGSTENDGYNNGIRLQLHKDNQRADITPYMGAMSYPYSYRCLKD